MGDLAALAWGGDGEGWPRGEMLVRAGDTVLGTHRMRAVTIDPDQRIAAVGSGATWHHVDRACAPHGLGTTAA